MYVLVKENRVIVGPKEWHQTLFQAFIDRYGVAITVPDIAPVTNTDLGEGVTVYEVIETSTDYNSKTQRLDGPFYVYTDVATQSFIPIDKSIEQVQSELDEIIAANRYKLENSGTTGSIQGNTVNLDTSRVKRNVYTGITEGSIVKFSTSTGPIFLASTVAELAALTSTISAFVQAAFVWEYSKRAEIQGAVDLPTLATIVLTAPGQEVITPGILPLV